ncbi:hypothetical protein DFH06DRAFT_1350384 [Mycena polygramma]|nr:hypothetical protein DFH06DRAFT_1350384 [Mycena polygramma]
MHTSDLRCARASSAYPDLSVTYSPMVPDRRQPRQPRLGGVAPINRPNVAGILLWAPSNSPGGLHALRNPATRSCKVLRTLELILRSRRHRIFPRPSSPRTPSSAVNRALLHHRLALVRRLPDALSVAGLPQHLYNLGSQSFGVRPRRAALIAVGRAAARSSLSSTRTQCDRVLLLQMHRESLCSCVSPVLTPECPAVNANVKSCASPRRSTPALGSSASPVDSVAYSPVVVSASSPFRRGLSLASRHVRWQRAHTATRLLSRTVA